MTQLSAFLQPLLGAWSDLGNRFSGRNAELHWSDIVTLVGVVGGGLLLVAALYLLQRYQQRRAFSNEPRHLFQDLCRLHDLSRKERRLLSRLATACKLPIPAALFVSPQYFEPEAMPQELAAHEVAIRKIATKLFVGLAEPLPTNEMAEFRPQGPAGYGTGPLLVPLVDDLSNAISAGVAQSPTKMF